MGTEYMINMTEWLCGDDAVQNKWSDLADEWEEEAKVLLDMIIELWVTVRGHSTAGAMMETHQIQKKQSLQKSKSITAKVGGTSKGTTSDKQLDSYNCTYSFKFSLDFCTLRVRRFGNGSSSLSFNL